MPEVTRLGAVRNKSFRPNDLRHAHTIKVLGALSSEDNYQTLIVFLILNMPSDRLMPSWTADGSKLSNELEQRHYPLITSFRAGITRTAGVGWE